MAIKLSLVLMKLLWQEAYLKHRSAAECTAPTVNGRTPHSDASAINTGSLLAPEEEADGGRSCAWMGVVGM